MSKSKTKRKTLAEQIRQAIIDSGITQYRIAKDTGISQPLLTRFVNGDRGISLDTADKLIEYLGLELRECR
ncbi:MAG: helix-turn-helix transcriptional regulator [Planctomycetaceae bacterium]|nr:helix-turn-helix transcriptional regulator [Planctomycetales bacterium]MCB9926623.1 helix-turn-helix transcriptional regulator [Planctomycetaceae bacterium]